MKRSDARRRLAKLRSPGDTFGPALNYLSAKAEVDEDGQEWVAVRARWDAGAWEVFESIEAFGGALKTVALAALPYAEYLATSHWDAVRRATLDRAQHRCQLCNELSGPLHVHHRTYERIGREADSDVIALCARCHDRFHSPDEDGDA